MLSPDGRSVAFIARVDKVTQLSVRALDAVSSRPLPGTEGVVSAFWSPDSSSLGFFTQDKLKRIATSGSQRRPFARSMTAAVEVGASLM